MKKKSPRGIPDFSRAPKGPKAGTQPDLTVGQKAGKRPSKPPNVKPQSTSSKSGQRGQ